MAKTLVDAGVKWTLDGANLKGAVVAMGPTAPVSPQDGDLWWDSSIGQMFVYYDDGDSQQWVSANPSGVEAAKLLGIASITADVNGITTEQDVSGLSVTVTVPAGRRIKLEAFLRTSAVNSSGSAVVTRVYAKFMRGTTERGFAADFAVPVSSTTSSRAIGGAFTFDTPSAGSVTYKIRGGALGTNASMNIEADANRPSWFAVWDVGQA